MSIIQYASAVRLIIYAILCTRFDMAYALGITSIFQVVPGEDHWKAMENIFKYLRSSRDIFLIYDGSDLKLKGYIDSNFQSHPVDAQSISWYVFTLYRSSKLEEF